MVLSPHQCRYLCHPPEQRRAHPDRAIEAEAQMSDHALEPIDCEFAKRHRPGDEP
jgi:hypothetical protein